MGVADVEAVDVLGVGGRALCFGLWAVGGVDEHGGEPGLGRLVPLLVDLGAVVPRVHHRLVVAHAHVDRNSAGGPLAHLAPRAELVIEDAHVGDVSVDEIAGKQDGLGALACGVRQQGMQDRRVDPRVGLEPGADARAGIGEHRDANRIAVPTGLEGVVGG